MAKSNPEVPGSAQFSQGDIIHRPPSESDEQHRWGIIVTADCDIAQDKSNARLSYLEIVTARYFLEWVWSSEVLRKLRTKTIGDAASLVNKATQTLDNTLNPLTAAELLEWLKDTTATEIVSSLSLPISQRDKYLTALECVELAYNGQPADTTPLERLKCIWRIQKLPEKSMRARLQQALDYNKATDFHLIPAIKGFDQLGFVVLLREVSSISHSDVSASALEYQISGNRAGYYVAGTSDDNLRYAISQKMAFLFSRIGMSQEFESHCDIVTQLVVNELFPESEEDGTHK